MRVKSNVDLVNAIKETCEVYDVEFSTSKSYFEMLEEVIGKLPVDLLQMCIKLSEDFLNGTEGDSDIVKRSYVIQLKVLNELKEKATEVTASAAVVV